MPQQEPQEDKNKQTAIDKIIQDAEQHLNDLYGRKDIKFNDALKKKLHSSINEGTGETITGADVISKEIAMQMSGHLPDGGPAASTIQSFFNRVRGKTQTVELSEQNMSGFQTSDIRDACQKSEKAIAERAELTQPKKVIIEEKDDQPQHVGTEPLTPLKEQTIHSPNAEQEGTEQQQEAPKDSKVRIKAKTTDDLPQKPKSKAPELGSAADTREMMNLHRHAHAVFTSAQEDHSNHQQTHNEQERAEAIAALEEKLRGDLRANITAAKNNSWRSYTGEYHVERDELAGIMAKKIADKVKNNLQIPTSHIADHTQDILDTAIDTLKKEAMHGTRESEEEKDKTYKKVSEEFLEHRTNTTDIRETLTGSRASKVSFDDKLAEATSRKVAEQVKLSLQQQQNKNSERSRI